MYCIKTHRSEDAMNIISYSQWMQVTYSSGRRVNSNHQKDYDYAWLSSTNFQIKLLCLLN
jgi:hypothetical protein